MSGKIMKMLLAGSAVGGVSVSHILRKTSYFRVLFLWKRKRSG